MDSLDADYGSGLLGVHAYVNSLLIDLARRTAIGSYRENGEFVPAGFAYDFVIANLEDEPLALELASCDWVFDTEEAPAAFVAAYDSFVEACHWLDSLSVDALIPGRAILSSARQHLLGCRSTVAAFFATR